jgi:hypothetical protein
LRESICAFARDSQASGEIYSHHPADAAIFLYGFGQGLRVAGRIAKLLDLKRPVDVVLVLLCGQLSVDWGDSCESATNFSGILWNEHRFARHLARDISLWIVVLSSAEARA